MPHRKRFNLFVYGTLMDPTVFRAVLGCSMVSHPEDADGKEYFYTADAVLNGYKKISPDNTYLYAVPDRGHRIRGYLIHGLPIERMAALKKYEGRNYSRRAVQVVTAEGKVRAYAFVGNREQLEHAFGWSFRDPLKQEILLAKKIDQAVLETQKEHFQSEEETLREAVAELRGSTIRDITRRHFEAGGISDYTIRQMIRRQALPDFTHLRANEQARPFLRNYLRLVMRQVVFNQIEEKVHEEFRYELDHLPSSPVQRTEPTSFHPPPRDSSDLFYERVASSLVALRLLNRSRTVLDVILADVLGELDVQTHRLVDYVRQAVLLAEALYDSRQARSQVIFVRTHTGFGHMPLGAELEFSNIGHDVIRDPQGQINRDPVYDGFLYFYDFALNELTWKLGGHVDDHHEKAPGKPRRGFFEVALGNLSVEANISKPITRDPWVLNQLIHQTMRFYDVRPHSVHISMQLRSQHKPDRDRLLPWYVVQCLFALMGDPGEEPDGHFRIRRLWRGEIVRFEPAPVLLFSSISRRYSIQYDEDAVSAPDESEGRYVQQFRFPRLSPDLNYEPLVLALKGVQIYYRPGDFLTPAQYENSPAHRRLFEKLLAWGESPSPIPEKDIHRFLDHVRAGLLRERRGQPAHSRAYIAWATDELAKMLEQFNARFALRRATAKK